MGRRTGMGGRSPRAMCGGETAHGQALLSKHTSRSHWTSLRPWTRPANSDTRLKETSRVVYLPQPVLSPPVKRPSLNKRATDRQLRQHMTTPLHIRNTHIYARHQIDKSSRLRQRSFLSLSLTFTRTSYKTPSPPSLRFCFAPATPTRPRPILSTFPSSPADLVSAHLKASASALPFLLRVPFCIRPPSVPVILWSSSRHKTPHPTHTLVFSPPSWIGHFLSVLSRSVVSFSGLFSAVLVRQQCYY